MPHREIARRLGRTLRWDSKGATMERDGRVEWQVPWPELAAVRGSALGFGGMLKETRLMVGTRVAGTLPSMWGSTFHGLTPFWKVVEAHLPRGAQPPPTSDYECPAKVGEIAALLAAGVPLSFWGVWTLVHAGRGEPFSVWGGAAFCLGPAFVAGAGMMMLRRRPRS